MGKFVQTLSLAMTSIWSHALAAMLIISCVLHCSYATISVYDKFQLNVGQSITERQNMWAIENTPSGSDNPTVNVNLTFELASTSPSKGLAVLFYPYSERGNVGLPLEENSKDVEICCTPELYAQQKCQAQGEVIYTPDAYSLIKYYPINGTSAAPFKLTQEIPIKVTNTYSFIIVNCRSTTAGDVVVNGDVEWRNPFGYLPGGSFPLYPFYGVIAFCYIFLSGWFCFLMFRHRHQLLRIQWGILLVIVLGICESWSAFGYHASLNNTGYHTVAALVFSIGFAILKKTVARTIVLLVSMGLSIIKYSLGTTKYKILLFSVVYFVFSLVYDIVETVQALSKTYQISNTTVMVIILPLSLLDTTFLAWMFISFARTIQQLRLRRQTVKLTMYKQLCGVFIATAALSVAVVLYQTIEAAIYSPEEIWRTKWMWPAFWQTLYFVVLSFVSHLWRPTLNNTRYGNAEVYADEDDAVQLESLSPLSGVEERKDEEMGNAKPVHQVRQPRPPPLDSDVQAIEHSLSLIVDNNEFNMVKKED